jgi:hypothetical protein
LIHFDENGFLISGKLIAGAVARSGTESSNPALSSGESGTNRCAGKRTRAETWDLVGLAWRSADGCGPGNAHRCGVAVERVDRAET